MSKKNGNGRQWYEVRVREQIAPEKWVKKSKFYQASSSADAVARYKGNGHIMWAEKVSRDKMLGIGEFFRLGDELLRDLRSGGTLAEKVSIKREIDHQKEKGKYFSRRRMATEA